MIRGLGNLGLGFRVWEVKGLGFVEVCCVGFGKSRVPDLGSLRLWGFGKLRVWDLES